ncbi:hypothetical protein [Paraburkholderia fungorum]|uniref:Uncharacterized protein n=1 Tax=Paraburkholderia fungorum TaxID=134537 RepID=A0AAW3V247_9BURK|nr:hypothetical protein [Paraburkholderia fungorum]MBB4515832.1 hypothetical protein [Paraburkholderia fungorum]MBB6203752.1 hypothetical protein [Paraburkholderia fungorum]
MNTMDTMKARTYNGPTNGALPVEHTDGNRMVDRIIAEQQAGLQAQAHRLRLIAALPQAQARAAASATEADQETTLESDA